MQVELFLLSKLSKETKYASCRWNIGLNYFLVNGHLTFIYAFSIFKVKVIIYQKINLKIFLNTIPPINFKNVFDLCLVH